MMSSSPCLAFLVRPHSAGSPETGRRPFYPVVLLLLSCLCFALIWSKVLADEHEAKPPQLLNLDWHVHLKEEIKKYVNSERTWGRDENLIFADHTIANKKIPQREPEPLKVLLHVRIS